MGGGSGGHHTMDASAERRPGAPVTVRPTSRLPNFLVIGAMKAGTTSLWHYLRTHPQVFMPDVKEVMFFDPRHNWGRGVAWYESQFQRSHERPNRPGGSLHQLHEVPSGS